MLSWCPNRPSTRRTPVSVPDTAPAEAVELDLRGLKCPLPALKTGAALRRLASPGRLLVAATDPLAAIDIPNAAREVGCRVLDQARLPDGALAFRIDKP